MGDPGVCTRIMSSPSVAAWPWSSTIDHVFVNPSTVFLELRIYLVVWRDRLSLIGVMEPGMIGILEPVSAR